jgi:hypothetical protein
MDSFLCRAGGFAAVALLVYCLLELAVMVLLGPGPQTAAEAFALLQNDRLRALLRLDLLTVIFMPAYYLLFAGFYAALRRLHATQVTVLAVLAFTGVTLFLSTPSISSLAYLSDQYSAATSEARRSQLLSAGEALLAADMWHSTAAFTGGLMLQTAGVWVSVLMLRGGLFGRATAYLGVIANGLDLAHGLVGLFAPGLGGALLMTAGPLYLAWFPLAGRRLLKLGSP